jgi:hypothetical protein
MHSVPAKSIYSTNSCVELRRKILSSSARIFGRLVAREGLLNNLWTMSLAVAGGAAYTLFVDLPSLCRRQQRRLV